MNRIGKYFISQLLLYKIKWNLPKRLCSQKLSNNKNSDEKSKKNDVDLNFDDLKEQLDVCLKNSIEGKETEIDKNFMNFSSVNQVSFICKLI